MPHPSSSSTSTSTGDGSLGLTLQWTPLSLATNVWHVLDVPPNSPADLAGLLPFSDYILGEAPTSLTTMADIATAPAADSAAGSGPASTSTATTTVLLHGEAGLGELVEDHLGRPLRLWVYNVEYDATREVEVVPSREWGGEGALGCVLGYGALHRLPPPLSEPVEAPGETMFDGGGGSVAGGGSGGFGSFGGFDAGSGGEYNEKTGAFIPTTAQVPNPAADFLVPAQLVAATASTTPPPSTSGGPTRGKKKDRHHAPHGGAGAGLMDDYFREEEEKSKRLDNAPSKVRPGIAPPPRAGGPPKAATTTASPPPQTQADEANTDAA